MASTTIRIRDKTHVALKEIAQATGQTMQDALETAIEERRRRLYLEGLSADYAALRADPRASDEFDKENALWDRANQDGLEEL